MKKKVSLLLVMVLVLCCFASTPTVAFAYDGAKPLPALTGVQAEDVAQIALSQVGYRKTDGTVYGAWWGLPYDAWCAMFACWCANQAGAGFERGSGASAQVTALFNYICKTGSYDITFQTDPRPGDFLFFKDADPTKRLPHVAIVTAYDSATRTVTYVGGNQYLNASCNSAVTLGTCKWESGAKVGKQYVYGYGRPAYKNVPTVVTSTTPELTSKANVYDYNSFALGERVTLQRNVVQDAQYYSLSLWHRTHEDMSISMDDVTYTLPELGVGIYTAVLTVGTPNGTLTSEFSFVVRGRDYNLISLSEDPVITSNCIHYLVGTDVILERNTIENSARNYMEVWREGTKILSTEMEPKHVLSGLQPGSYDVYLEVQHSMDNAIAQCNFIVHDESTFLSPPNITSDKDVYQVGENVTLQRNTVANSNIHWITLWHNGEQILSTNMDDINYVLSNLQVGLYDVFLQVGNAVATEQTSYTFTVQETVIQDHEHDFSEYTVEKKATLNEWGTVAFNCSECDATEEYEIPEVNAAVLAKYNYTYNGKNNKPSVTVTDVEGNKLVKETDYSVKYSGNGKSVGRYKVTVTLKGLYSGTKNLYYYVMPKAPTGVEAIWDESDSVTVSWKKSTGATGYYVYYKESTDDTYIELGSTEELTYTEENLQQGVEYDFKIVPYYIANEKIYFSNNVAKTSVVLSEDE